MSQQAPRGVPFDAFQAIVAAAFQPRVRLRRERSDRACRQDAAQRFLRPDARTLRRVQRALRQALGGDEGRDGRDPAVARRLGQAGARSDRRARSRRRHAGAGRRRRRALREGQPDSEGLAEAAAEQQLPVHLDDRAAGAQGKPEGDPGLGGRRQAGRRRDHAESEDLRRRALELPRRLGLRPRQVERRRGQGARTARAASTRTRS